MSKNRLTPSISESKSTARTAKYSFWGAVVASIIGLFGVILAAYIGYLGIRSQTEMPINATQTAEAKYIISTYTPLTVTPTTTAAMTITPSIVSSIIKIEQSLGQKYDDASKEIYWYYAMIENKGQQSAEDISLVIYFGIMNPFQPSACSLRAPFDTLIPRIPTDRKHISIYTIDYLPSGGTIEIDCAGELKYDSPIYPSIKTMYSGSYECLIDRKKENYFNLDGVPVLEFTARNIGSDEITYCHHYTRP